MADLLVMNQDNGPDPMQYKVGMVVDVFPSGKLNPGVDQHPRFWVVRLPNVTEAEARQLLDMQLSTLVLQNGMPTTIGRRKDAFDAVKIPAAILNQLTANREITFTQTWAQIQAFITRKWPDQ
jgi:hypothetical protein